MREEQRDGGHEERECNMHRHTHVACQAVCIRKAVNVAKQTRHGKAGDRQRQVLNGGDRAADGRQRQPGTQQRKADGRGEGYPPRRPSRDRRHVVAHGQFIDAQIHSEGILHEGKNADQRGKAAGDHGKTAPSPVGPERGSQKDKPDRRVDSHVWRAGQHRAHPAHAKTPAHHQHQKPGQSAPGGRRPLHDLRLPVERWIHDCAPHIYRRVAPRNLGGGRAILPAAGFQPALAA